MYANVCTASPQSDQGRPELMSMVRMALAMERLMHSAHAFCWGV
jgi:hypothetical protein